MMKQELEEKLATESPEWWNGLPEAGSTNSYRCENCHYVVVTVDVDRGVTPAFLQCKNPIGCRATMTSNWYRTPNSVAPMYEWYRPDEAELVSIDRHTLIHVMRGGLLLREARI